MKQLTYLNGILTIIAVCLILITLAVTDLLPKANAAQGTGAGDKKYLSIPVNADGSINVKFAGDVLDVNIKEVGGYSTYGTVPVKVGD